MSKPRSRRGLVCSGLSAAAIGAALLVAPQAAYAAVGNVGPNVVMPGGNATIFDSTSPFITTPVVHISTGACAGTKPSPLPANVWAATGATRVIDGNTTTNMVQFTVPSASGPTVGANSAIKPYNVCVYDNATAAAPLSTGTFYVGAQGQASPMAGLPGGGSQITVTVPSQGAVFTTGTTFSAIFNAGTCANTSASPVSNMVASGVTKESNTSVRLTVPVGAVSNSPNSTPYNICLYDSTGNLLTFAQYNVYSVALSPASGSYLTANGVVGNSTVPFLSGVTTPGVLVVPGMGCPGTVNSASGFNPPPVAVTSPSVRRLTNYRVAVTIPALTQQTPNANQPLPYSVCFFANASDGPLVGSGFYSSTVVANPTAVMPPAGPAAGGTVITVVGTNFPTEPGRITATLGGVPLTDIQPQGSTMFTARTPAHAVEDNVTLVVTTSAGTKALQNAFSYVNPVKVTPNTAPNTTPTVDVSVQGMGFMSMNFGTGGNSARVFLVRGVYNGAEAASNERSNGPVTECTDVLVISDEEMICTLRLNRRLDATGALFNPITYTQPLTLDVVTTAGSRVITSEDGLFNPSDVGQKIVQAAAPTNIPLNATITSVLGRTKAVISEPSPLATTTAVTATIGASAVHSFTNSLIATAGSTTVTLAPGAATAFTAADVGRVFSGTTGIPVGATIVAVAPGGASATISEPAAGNPATIADVTSAPNSASITSNNLTAADINGVVTSNTIGIAPGTRITNVTGGGPSYTGTLSPAAGATNTGAGQIIINRAVNGSLFPAAPVPQGAYNLTVVSNGNLDAETDDPNYFQTAVTSSSVFTVGPF